MKFSFKENKNAGRLTWSISGNPPKEQIDQMNEFVQNYELELGLPYQNFKRALKNRKSRICSFCGKGYPEVTFKKDAHLIPQLLGNKTFLSDEECDACNHTFSKYEDALANFLGVTRTFNAAKGQNGIPKFKNPDKSLEIVREMGRVNIIVTDDNNYEVNEDANEIVLNTILSSYKPIYVYKIMLKIFYSILPGSSKLEYENSKKILLNDNLDLQLKGDPTIRMSYYFCAGTMMHQPLACIWKKKSDSKISNIPSRILVLHFQQYIFQIMPPWSTENIGRFKEGDQINFLTFPALVDEEFLHLGGNPQLINIDLSDSTLKRGELQRFILHFDNLIWNKPED